jgi:D-alanine-D-alanine ligase
MHMKKIVVLHSDISPEATQDELDCLIQAQTIAAALRELSFQPMLVPFSLDLNHIIARLQSLKPFAVFNLVETLASSGRLIHFAPAVLDHLKIPYTGCPTEAVFQTSNKPLAKRILKNFGVATPDWLEQDGTEYRRQRLKWYLIKSSWEHASIGLDEKSLIEYKSKETVLKAMKRREKCLGGSCFAEAYIEGREFNVALISRKEGVIVLPIAEMLFHDYAPDKLKIVDYKAKWDADSFEYNNTIRKFDFSAKDRPLIDRLKEIALMCWKIFSLKGYARVDFRVDQKNRPWVLEINTNPCLSPDAGFAAALNQAKIPYTEAIGLILADAVNRF